MRMVSRLFLAAFAASFLAAFPALAQDTDLRGLSEEIERLGKDIRDIQLYIFRGEDPAASIMEAGVSRGETGNEAIAATMEIRFGEVEERFRALTGQIEEIAHGVSVVSERVEKLVKDIDFRLNAIEQAQAEALALAMQRPDQSAAPRPAGQNVAAGKLLGAQPPAAEPGTLGTLSLSAVSSGDAAAAGEAYFASPPPAPALPAGTVKEQYDYAFSLLRQQEYAEAERALTAFIETHPDVPLSGNANYWLAETYYVRGDFHKAAGYFAAGYKNFPDGNKASDNLLKLAMSLANLKETDQACLTFKELSERYPDAPPSIKQRAAFESQRAGCG